MHCLEFFYFLYFLHNQPERNKYLKEMNLTIQTSFGRYITKELVCGNSCSNCRPFLDDVSLNLILYEERELLVGCFTAVFTAVDIFLENVVLEEDTAYNKSASVPSILVCNSEEIGKGHFVFLA